MQPVIPSLPICSLLISYYGLDISPTRLKSGFKIKLPQDRLLLGDLCHSLPLQACFDCVVRYNTLSHLPIEQQILALNNLIISCKSGGSFYINTSIDSNFPFITQALSNAFESVQIVYFDSFKSVEAESNNSVNPSNVYDLMAEK